MLMQVQDFTSSHVSTLVLLA